MKLFTSHLVALERHGSSTESPRSVDEGVIVIAVPGTYNDGTVIDLKVFNSMATFKNMAQKWLAGHPALNAAQLYCLYIVPRFGEKDQVNDESTWQNIKNSPRDYMLDLGYMYTASLPLQWPEEKSSVGSVGTKRLWEDGEKDSMDMDLQFEAISHLHDRVKTLENYLV